MKLKKYLIGIFVLVVLFTLGFFLLNKKVIASTSSQIRTKEILEDKFYELKFNINSASPLSYEAKNQLAVDQGSNHKEYLSAVIYPNFQFGLLGFRWEGEEQAEPDIQIEVRFLDKNNNWTKWVAVEKDDNSTGRDTKIQTKISEPVISPESVAFQYKIELTRNAGRSPSLDFLKFTCIDSSESISQRISSKLSKSFNQVEAASTAGVNIISRAGWGCPDPNNTMFAGTGRYWPAEYVHWQKVIIHHTVTANNDPNPDQTVRNIWQYHAISNDWGDIGYNFLVSADGRVYQGRFGNNNVVGGHARPYNYGTIGIAVLGTYSDVPISWPPFDALTSLIAQKSHDSGFTPAGSSNFQNSLGGWFYNMPNIVGHRDCAATECPGIMLYNQLSLIRNTSQSKYNALDYSSQFSNQSAYPTLNPGQQATVWIDYKNTGPTAWYNFADGSHPRVNLATSHPINRRSAFGSTWGGDQNRPGTFTQRRNGDGTLSDTSVINPGETAHFQFVLKAPVSIASTTYREYFQPIVEGVTTMNDPGTFLNVTVPTITYSSQFYHQSSYPYIKTGQQANVFIYYRNTGNVAWYNSATVDHPRVNLATSHPINRRSSFGSAWGGDQNRPGTFHKKYDPIHGTILTTNVVNPNEIAIFEFTLTAQNGIPSGAYSEYFQPIVEGVTTMNDPWTFLNVSVISNTPVYTSQFSNQSAYPTLNPGQQATVWLDYKNKGNTAWYNSATADHPRVNLATSHPINRRSAFGSTWGGDQNRPGTFTQRRNGDGTLSDTSVINPGETAHFQFVLKAPVSIASTTYREYFQPIVEGVTTMNDPWTFLKVTVPGIPGTKVQVTSNGSYKIVDLQDTLLATCGAGAASDASYSNGVYYVSAGGIHTSSYPIHFVPLNGAIMQILTYSDSSYGNNYNEFRDIIEVCYSPNSNKVWVINQLRMQEYINGICETGNGSPGEYYRTMAIVARSYAYWHSSRHDRYPGEPFDLKNSRNGNGNDQVYRGYVVERVFPNVPTYSSATSGQVVNYPGYLVCITPYSHGGRRTGPYDPLGTLPGSGNLAYPWLQGSWDAYGDLNAWLNNPAGNHLIGLSASGASGYANAGVGASVILKHYYAGTGVGSIGDPGIRIAIYGF